MSEHLEMSEDSSLDRNFQIRTNNQGENELYIPCWEEEGSSSTQYHHLIEETKFFKNKCKHLENHLEENHREFSSLNQLYMIAESNERRLLKENEELKKRIKDLLNELSEVNTAHELAQSETQAMSKRENELRERLFRSKERQTQLANQLDLLESELEATKLKPTVSPRNSDQEEKWKKNYTEMMAQMEERWKTAYEELEGEFDRKSKELKQKNQEIKAIQKSINSIREDHDEKIKGLNGEIEDLKRQITRTKAVSTDHQRNVRDLKAVLEQVSVKNDEIERQNNKLRSKLKQESNRYIKLQKESRQQLQLSEEGKKLLEQQQTQNNSLRNMLNELKGKSDKLEKQLGQLKLDKDRILVTKNHLENVNAALRDEISQLNQKIQQQNESIIKITQEKIKEAKQKSIDELSALSFNLSEKDRQISSLQRQITALQRQTSQELGGTNNKEQINKLRTEIAQWKSKFEKIDNLRRDLERQASTVIDCGHNAELRSLKEQIHGFESTRQQFKQAHFKQEKIISDLKNQLTESYIKSGQQSQEKDRLFKENQRLQQQKEHLNTQNSRLKEDRHSMSDRQKNREKLKAGSEQELNAKTLLIQQLRTKLVQTEREMETIRSTKVKEEAPQKDREKLKKIEAKLQERDNLLQEQQIKIQELQSRAEDAEAARKSGEKELRSKENDLIKRDRKIKQLERELDNTHILEREIQELKQEIEAIRKQLRSEQMQHEKLKVQVAKCQDKENTRQGNNQEWNSEKMKIQVQWEEKYRKLTNILKIKQQEIVNLKREFEQIKKPNINEPSMAEQKRISGQLEQSLRQRIKELEQQVQKLQQSLRNARDQDPNASLEQLEAEYQRQLLALKRLIVYKGFKEDEGKRNEQIRAQYEAKIQILLSDYKLMQQDLIILRQKLLIQRPEPTIDVAAIEEAWRIRIEQLADEREVLIQRVSMWERKYEELRYLFETKLQAKEEAINLLNLKLSNLQMSRTSLPPPCPYPCHHR